MKKQQKNKANETEKQPNEFPRRAGLLKAHFLKGKKKVSKGN